MIPEAAAFPTHEFAPGDNGKCAGCPDESVWLSDEVAHRLGQHEILNNIFRAATSTKEQP